MTSGDAALDLAHPSPEPKPLARVYGEPVNEMPQRPLHPAGSAGSLPRDVRGAARPAALPDPAAEHQRARHADGRAHAPVPGLRRDDAPHAARARGGIPADGRRADRDQVAPAAAASAGAAGDRARRSARGARAPAARIRADEAGRARDRRAAARRARFLDGARMVRPPRRRTDARRRARRSARGMGGADRRARARTGIIWSRASSCRCAPR